MLRHAAAKEMLNSGIDLKTIANVLGHESVETTLSKVLSYIKDIYNLLQ